MTERPAVTIIMPIDPQTDRLERCVISWDWHLIYDGPLRLHISGAGEGSDNIVSMARSMNKWTLSTSQHQKSIGDSLNIGLNNAWSESPIMAYFGEASLDDDYDITPWVDTLMNDTRIGMIRLGPPSEWNTGTVERLSSGWAFILRRCNQAFDLRPALYHKRFFDAYGMFPEGVDAGGVTMEMMSRYMHQPGKPQIALALPHPWIRSNPSD